MTLSKRELTPNFGTVRYRYSRNGYSYITAEYLEPDTNDFFWTEKGRSVSFEPGNTQEDTVARWRWFPEGDLPTEDISGLGPIGQFPARIDNIRFRSGQGIQDLYIDAFDDFFRSTAEHIKKVGYEWAVFYPAWQWDDNGVLPRVIYYPVSPNYSDEKLLEQMEAFRDVGIKLILGPQVCCTPIQHEGRSKEWWEEYFNEVERFLIHHAKLAEEVGADAFFADFADIGVTRSEEDEIMQLEQEAWSRIWTRVRELYSGEIGQMVWNFGVVKFDDITPGADFITWADQLDFFYVQSEGEITPSMNPADSELLAGVERELDAAKQLYDRHGKPVIVQTAYPSSLGSWRGFEFRPLGSGCGESDPENDCFEIFSEIDQARVVDAHFQAISERPWIIGYFHFGYWHWEMPLLPDWSTRGKAAEDLWKEWNDVIYGTGS